VLNDYAIHREFILEQKQRQYQGLNDLLTYIEGLTHYADDIQEILDETKEDQINILNEMKQIKSEINYITKYNKNI
jgi:hypothetical protein